MTTSPILVMINLKGRSYVMKDALTDIINNAWVISIVTGVLVYLATNWFSKFKDNKEYRKNINQVTEDIVVMLQEFIVEKQLPEKAVLFSYYTATCEKYNVLVKDTKSIVEILDFLTKEILDSQFLNGTNKLVYCNIIESYKLNIKNDSIEKVSVSEEFTSKQKKEEESYNKIRNQLSFMIAVVSSILTMLSTYLVANGSVIVETKENLLLFVLIMIILFTTTAMYILIKIPNKRKQK